MNSDNLPHLESTMTNLEAYLMVASHKHPRYILGSSGPKQHFGITQHYTAALLSIGLPSDDEHLQKVADWFANPPHQSPVIDVSEMNRLEALLNLRPKDPSVQNLLARLIKQRSPSTGLFKIVRNQDHDEDDESQSSVFDTAWALKIIMSAREKAVLHDLFTYTDIQNTVNTALFKAEEDKNIALLLRLQHELTPELDQVHLHYLSELLLRGAAHGYVWGLKEEKQWKQIAPIIQAMQRYQLTPDLIAGSRSLFLRVIMNTCYVIENLSPLRRHHEVQLAEPLQKSVELWWQQFCGENPSGVLLGLFDEYNFLRILCRTLIAIRTFIGHALGTKLWLNNIRTVSQNLLRSDKEDFEKALRHWIGITLKEPIHLELGLSKAKVVRIYPTIYNPIDPTQEPIFRRSLIVKYGPREVIEKERENFDKLPEAIRGHFVRIPNTIYENDRQQFFVIMQDLSGYRTLFENFDKLLRHDDLNLAEQLGNILTEIHHCGYNPQNTATNSHLHDLYFNPMMEQIDFIFTQVNRLKTYQILLDARYGEFGDRFADFLNLHHNLLRSMGTILEKQAYFEGFPLAYMHGDLHSRNIMVRKLGKISNVDIRLIDVEKLETDGDSAHDAGQLLTDLELLRITSDKKVSWKVIQNQEKLVRDLKQIYLDFALERHDTNFETRLDLARARASIRIAKGQAKRIDAYLEQRGQQQAFELLTEAMHIAEGASFHLENVCRRINQSVA